MIERSKVALALREKLSLNKFIRRQSYVSANFVPGFSASEADPLMLVKNKGNVNTKRKTGNLKATLMFQVASEMRNSLVLQVSKQLSELSLGIFSELCLIPKLMVLSSNCETAIPGVLCKQNLQSVECNKYCLVLLLQRTVKLC